MSKFPSYAVPALVGGIGALFLVAVNFADRFVTPVPPAPDRSEAIARYTAPPPSPLMAAVAQAGAMGTFGLGRPALPEEIAAWDVDVRPDGTGLPPGSGDVLTGERLFEDNCAACHGSFAEGVDNWPKLAGGDGTLADDDPLKTVGSYWPYLSTAWDYVHRSMPFGAAQTLSDDEVYAIVAYVLYSNDLVDDDFVLSDANFLEVELPNADGFIVDDRAETEYPAFSTEPCMENCKESVEITMRARVLDVTPVDEAEAEAAAAMEDVNQGETAETEMAAVEVPAEAAAQPVAAADPALVAEGEKVFRKCASCHQVGEGAKNRTGPHLNGILGRTAGGAEGFKYSSAFGKLADEGMVWTDETLAAFLADPKGYARGTRMAFAGLRDEADIAALTAYLATFGE